MNSYLRIIQLNQLSTHGQCYFIYHFHPPLPHLSQPPHPQIILKEIPIFSLFLLQGICHETFRKLVVCSSNFSTSIKNKGYLGAFIIYFPSIFIITKVSFRVKIIAKDGHVTTAVD